MKTLIIILILAAFLQTTILPIDLVLLILICRAYVIGEKGNLYLAFAFGLFTSHLNLTNLGLHSLIYLIAVQIVQLLSKSNLAGNPLLILPISFSLMTLNKAAESVVSHSAFDFSGVIVATILSLPIFYIIRLWEERFVVRSEIKLKV